MGVSPWNEGQSRAIAAKAAAALRQDPRGSSTGQVGVSEYVSASLRRLVSQRASQRCEYCLIHEDDALLPHEPDHVVAVKHRGETVATNLACTCFVCNRAKGSDISSIDPESNELVRLFHPRRDEWEHHFVLESDGRITPLTNVGRVTVRLLRLNRVEHLEIRRLLYRGNPKPK